ncbi:hypothetical protein TW79_11945 [Tritonibacter mobilis]|uniref:Uncharacterized protein n=2 Tax=Tritonibacter mobilis TaxID=379347 RepID=A0A1B1A037_9RHOB|nr:hypothetical protein K529_003620 [Tritonibacter mobilis F1926]KJZ24013.1 hypothetical protein TW79_11945 [Tritonibacter mobilis]NKX37291.1 hypothetical protein [Rhodobacteraceae bacterium R_SAG4]NKX74082.1 hypothetical protein [Rhodobacteraceae bacterium R_SAG3]MBU3034170.1 hypothetical protein [Tritonibacter mobilis]
MQSAFVPDAALHALVCGTCGAPLSAQKQRPLSEHKGAKMPKATKPAKAKKPKKSKSGDWGALAYELANAKLMKKHKKKKKSSWKKVFDVIEDIFD